MSIQIVSLRGRGMVFWNKTSVKNYYPNLKSLYNSYNDWLFDLPKMEKDLGNHFYALAHHTGINGAVVPQRTASTFDYQDVIPFDIDGCLPNRALEYAAIVCAVLDVPIQSATVIDSGNGVHVIFHLKHPIRHAKYFNETRHAYKELVHKIDRKIKDAGLEGTADPKIWDPARVLRFPGTINKKEGKSDKICNWIQSGNFAEQDIDILVISGCKALSESNISPVEVRRKYPKPDFNEMVKECSFVKWTLENPLEVREPHFFSLASVLSCQPIGVKAKLADIEMTPYEVAEKVFYAAENSDSLREADFSQKWEESLRYGAQKCATIGENIGWPGCETCPHFGKINTPLALKSKDHIGSDPVGYWVLNAKGQPMHPHYTDLALMYQQMHPFVVTNDERVLIYNEKFYEESMPRPIKSWLDKTVNPVEPLREQHRIEFLNKIKSTPTLKETEDKLFIDNVKSKLNCQNGVLDILSGELVPHSPHLAFKWVLPYSYDPNAQSEYFIDWLGVVTDNRPELMDSILDYMAYCLWPSYDDHVFMYLIGDGKNGKSTLIEIIRALVGLQNTSAVSIQQLCGNRFAPASLEDKLVNLSEESSGEDNTLSADQVDILKNLSSGGTLLVERKGEQAFDYKNRAKLIFSANKPPKFHESGIAIRRRMLAIPFDHTIENPDSNVSLRLTTTEIPGIMAMLVKRLRDNVTRNGGRFVVTRGGVASEEAQMKVLTSGNSVVEWAKDSIEASYTISSEHCLTVNETYGHYKTWCDENGYKYAKNKNSFSKDMCTFIVPTKKSEIRSVSGVSSRVYRNIKFKEEVIN